MRVLVFPKESKKENLEWDAFIPGGHGSVHAQVASCFGVQEAPSQAWAENGLDRMGKI